MLLIFILLFACGEPTCHDQVMYPSSFNPVMSCYYPEQNMDIQTVNGSTLVICRCPLSNTSIEQ